MLRYLTWDNQTTEEHNWKKYAHIMLDNGHLLWFCSECWDHKSFPQDGSLQGLLLQMLSCKLLSPEINRKKKFAIQITQPHTRRRMLLINLFHTTYCRISYLIITESKQRSHNCWKNHLFVSETKDRNVV